MTNKNNILIADDHPLFREALTYIVESSFSTFSEASKLTDQIETTVSHTVDYDETLSHLEKKKIDWLFLDLNMPNSDGLNGLMYIRKNFPEIPIIIISANESPEIIQSCIATGVKGYITKSTLPENIEHAIHQILEGKLYSPIRNDSNSSAAKNFGIESLTSAQLNILTHIGKGRLNKQIAQDLGITEATVKAHITQIYKKLNVKNRTKAALIAQQAQLVN